MLIAFASLLTFTSYAKAYWSPYGGAAPQQPFGSSFGVPGKNASYDYIVVGGGLAGLVVATRLAEDPSLEVAVVEAGGFYEISNGNHSQIPAYSTEGVSADPQDILPLIDWGILSPPQPQLNDRVIHYAQGRCLGGSSARNQMIYHRPTIGSFQKWADMVGDQNYTWENMLPFFKKSIKFTPPNTALRAANASAGYRTDAYDPKGGPLQVSFSNYAQPISSFAGKAFAEIGIPPISDFSSGYLNGSQYNPCTIDPADETRSSSETSFLRQALQSSALKVYQSAMVKKIIFNEDREATGVLVKSGSIPYVLNARKEVVLSAGAFHSPQLLMVSGIGPADTLRDLRIPILADRPGVGQNMKDSVNSGSITFRVNIESVGRLQSNETYASNAIKDYITNHTGPLTSWGADYIGWEKLPQSSRSQLGEKALSDLSQFPPDWPEVEYVVTGSSGALASSEAGDYAAVGVALVAAISRGNVTIRSADNDVQPVVNPNWLLEETDQKVAVAGYRRVREMWRFMAPRVAIGPEFAPGADLQSDEEILGAIKSQLSAVHHASATCAMRKADDPEGVVDSHGKVFGVSKLRVIDSSSLPFTPPGHTQGVTYAHAEKLVNDIKEGR